MMEDIAYILDFLPQGRPGSPPAKRVPTILAIGEEKFTLLELIPKPGVTLELGEKVYIGKDADRRDKIRKIRERITYADLTPAAHGEVPYIVEDIVEQSPEKYLQFFNLSAPVTLRFHALELLPGMGKKSVETVLGERQKKPFESYADLAERAGIKHPVKPVAARIMQELREPDQKYYVFTRPPRDHQF